MIAQRYATAVINVRAALAPPGRYCHVAVVSAGRQVHISGQIALDAMGQVVGEGDLSAQAEQVFANLAAGLAAAGADFSKVFKTVSYVVGLTPEIDGIIRAQVVLGQPLWVPAAPTGFSDFSITWVEGLTQRLDLAAEYAERSADRLNPVRLVDTALGPLASDRTRQTIGFAGSRQQALTLLLLAPEFQRR